VSQLDVIASLASKEADEMMRGRRLKVIVGAATVAALGLGGAAMAGSGTIGADDADQSLRGPQAERAGEAAANAVRGGSATGVERDSDGRTRYEVEVQRSDGSTVDVDVDESFRVIATDDDSEREGADRDDEPDDRDDAGEPDDD
jgi:uncharacterized membrane protein YkoI